MLCVSAQVYLFIYLFYIMINCTVFGESEMVHVKIKEQQSEEHNMESSWSILR